MAARVLLAATALVVVVASPAAAQRARTLEVGRSARDSLTSREPVLRGRGAPYHLWTFRGRRGERLRFDLSSSDFDVLLRLRDPDGFRIGEDDDSGEGTAARLHAILPRDGRYTLIVTGVGESSRGAYTISMTQWDPGMVPGPGRSSSIAIGETKLGLLEPGDEVSGDGPLEDRWTIELAAGAQVRFELRSEDMDAYLTVLGPGGERLASDDDALGGRDALVWLRAPRAGSYTALASSFGDQPASGAYRLTVVEEAGEFAEPGARSTIALGDTRLGRLERGDSVMGDSTYADVYLFQPAESGEAVIDLTSRDFDAFLTIQDAEGRPLASDDDGGSGTDARLVHLVTAGTSYRIVVSSYGSELREGSYRLAVRLTR